MKFKVIRLKPFLATAFVAVLVMCAVCIQWYIDRTVVMPVNAIVLSGKTILIDPGHGGFDAGASDNSVVEKELNLAVAKYLRDYIEKGGGRVYMTRDTDADTADPNRSSNITQKKSDLQMRKSDIKKYKADLFISIHMNKFEQPQYKGAQVFYEESNEKNKFLAESIQQAVKDVLDDENKRVPKGTGKDIFVLRGNTIPSALIECGFLSNPQEAELLKTPEYQKKLAEGIYNGIVKFLNY